MKKPRRFKWVTGDGIYIPAGTKLGWSRVGPEGIAFYRDMSKPWRNKVIMRAHNKGIRQNAKKQIQKEIND